MIGSSIGDAKMIKNDGEIARELALVFEVAQHSRIRSNRWADGAGVPSNLVEMLSSCDPMIRRQAGELLRSLGTDPWAFIERLGLELWYLDSSLHLLRERAQLAYRRVEGCPAEVDSGILHDVKPHGG